MEAGRLRWTDAAAGYGLAIAGTVAVSGALRMQWLPGIVASYAAHAWLGAIALYWYFGLRRRFPVGTLAHRQLLPWYVLWLLAIGLNAAQAFGSPPDAVRLPSPPLLAADVIFLALVVGPTEELLFRGLVQTGLNSSISASLQLAGWQLRLGTVIAAVLFGLSHLVNLAYQSIATTSEQVLIGIAIGLVIGIVYDSTRNLVGAAVLHGLLDLTGTALPWVAYFFLR